jgi:iron complex transport system substrate-binding protein
MGWESVVAAEPDVVVLVDSAWNSADNKISVLEANPLTAALPAVQEGRYLIVDFAATEAGIRNVDAAASLAEQLDAMP